MKGFLYGLLALASLSMISQAADGAEVNCAGGSSISGIDGFGISVSCNEAADRLIFHRSLLEDMARKRLKARGLDLTDDLRPSSAVVSISVTSTECRTDDDLVGYATSINVDMSRASLCYIADKEFHAISSIVWEEDRLLVSEPGGTRDLIIGVLNKLLDQLASDLEKADPDHYDISSLDM